jgi:hypothetical protein
MTATEMIETNKRGEEGRFMMARMLFSHTQHTAKGHCWHPHALQESMDIGEPEN